MARRRLVQVALVSWLVARIPHGIFHFRHVDSLDTTQAGLQSTVLGVMFVLPLWLLWRSARRLWWAWSQTT